MTVKTEEVAMLISYFNYLATTKTRYNFIEDMIYIKHWHYWQSINKVGGKTVEGVELILPEFNSPLREGFNMCSWHSSNICMNINITLG